VRAYPAPDQAAVVQRIAMEEGVDPRVLLAIWEQESGRSIDPELRGQTLTSGRWAGHVARGPFQIMSFHGPIPEDFEGQARWAAKHLKERGVRGYYGEGKAPAGFPSTDEYERQVLAKAGMADVPQGLLGQGQAAQVPQVQPPMRQEAQMDEELLGGGAMGTLLDNPWLMLGASILANNDSRNTGRVLGKGLLTGLAAMERQREARALEQYRRQQLQAQQNPRSANIAEYEYLRQQGVPHDQAMRYSFAGNAGYGERGMMMGNVPMVQVTNPDGTTSLRPMAPEELEYRRGVIEEEKRTASKGEGYGKQTADLTEQINKVALSAPSLIKQTDQLIADIEGGKYRDTGPITGRLTEYWSPEIADLQFKATEQVLQNLQIVNLAPVTIKELELMGQLYAGAYKTPEQNLAVLRYLNGRAKERLRRMRKLGKYLSSGGKIEDLPQWVEDEFDPFDEAAPLPNFQAEPTTPAVPAVVPQKPAGMPDEQWQELLRLRGMTGGR
jgi:hypothetical protein